jgi:hypothetical protein
MILRDTTSCCLVGFILQIIFHVFFSVSTTVTVSRWCRDDFDGRKGDDTTMWMCDFKREISRWLDLQCKKSNNI